MSIEVESDVWTSLDPWWSAYAQTHPIARIPASARLLDIGRLTDCWEELDPWWDIYTETGQENVVEIADLLKQSNDAWRQSDSPFNTDPLAADLTLDGLPRGPIQPSDEVSWSKWLAQLLAPSAELITELFDVEVDGAGEEIVREELLSKQGGSDRRPDILVCYADCGVSIEVKLGDENYEKTAETAELIERHYDDREWTHALLLPKRKKGRLTDIVEPFVRERSDGQTQIQWDDPGPITVVFWSDVTATIRSLLWGEVVDDHWAANAYLFCAVVEQQIMGFQPQPVIKRLVDPATVVEKAQPIWFADTLEEQLTYLRERVDP